MKLLVVEDSVELRQILCLLLRCEGHDAVEAENGRIALETLGSGEGFHLVISDMRMPEMGGVEFFRRFRARGLGIPFIGMTGYSDVMTAEHASALGMSGFIAKPFDRSTMLECIRRVLSATAGGLKAS